MKGICFKEPLFIATIKGIKTQTRRIINPQPDDTGLHNHSQFPLSVDSQMKGYWGTVSETGEHKQFKPRYNVGEVLYLKEPYYDWDEWCPEDGEISYKFDNPNKCVPFWNNKLFMPKRYARYFIKITAVRAERLQDISDEDCIREGIIEERIWGNHTEWFTYCNGIYRFTTPREAYKELINSIHGKGTWEENPFVWVYDYELCE